MKRIFSKRSGFTLVEIIIAFAIFAIMASMICQILNLMVRRKVQNKQYEDKLSAQEMTYVTKEKDMEYTATTADGQLQLLFKDNGGAAIPVDPINYQLKNWDDDNPKDSINYFAGDYTYDMDYSGSDTEGGDPEGEDPDKKTLGGSSQMDRFDTRLTGTKGIDSIQITVDHTDGTKEYKMSVTVYDSGVDESLKGHQQVTMYFAKDTPGADFVKIVSLNDDRKDWDALLEIKPCGSTGVNIHCLSDSFNGATAVFNVELEEEIPSADIAFGSNVDGNTYRPFTLKDKDGNVTDTYVNIFGAYEKPEKVADKTDGDGESTPEE